jgi:hypothetical protein
MRNLGRGLALLFPIGLVASCISTSSGLGQAAGGCPEFHGDSIDANVNVDVKVKAFMQASADLTGIVEKTKSAVKTACINIDNDLGAKDTWTELGDVDDAIWNNQGTGACNAAQTSITTIMSGPEAANADFALIVSRGACHEDFQAEASCETSCSTQQVCDPGTVETRCEPGQLAVKCDDKCKTQSVCEGTVQVEACHGSCSGTCIDEHGKKTDNDPNCRGKCTAGCSGTCTGDCTVQVDAGISCGTSVYCRGSCTTTYTDPVCETEFTPPSCTIDQTCLASCRASAAATATCNPPSVILAADVTQGPDIGTLVTTVNANLPPLVALAEQEANLVVKAGGEFAATGSAVLNEAGNLDGHSLACATAAATQASTSAGTLSVSANAGTSVTTSCSQHAQ